MGETSRAITLTEAERAAVIELGLRPTYSIDPGTDRLEDPEATLRNAELMIRAAKITAAGAAGRIPPELHAEVRELLREAIHETRHELWRERRGLDRWRAGDQACALAGVPEEDHERCYAEQIDRCARLLEAMTSLALKLTP